MVVIAVYRRHDVVRYPGDTNRGEISPRNPDSWVQVARRYHEHVWTARSSSHALFGSLTGTSRFVAGFRLSSLDERPRQNHQEKRCDDEKRWKRKVATEKRCCWWFNPSEHTLAPTNVAEGNAVHRHGTAKNTKLRASWSPGFKVSHPTIQTT